MIRSLTTLTPILKKRIDKKWWYLVGAWQTAKTGMEMRSLKDDCEG